MGIFRYVRLYSLCTIYFPVNGISQLLEVDLISYYLYYIDCDAYHESTEY